MGQSALGQGAVVNDGRVKASSGDSSPDFLDGKVGNSLKVSSNLLEIGVTGEAAEDSLFFDGTDWVTRGGTEKIKSNFLTRDMSTASGTQAVTGVGFRPSHCIFFACTDGGIGACWGNDNGSDSDCIRDQTATVTNQYGSGGNSVEIRPASGTSYSATIQSFDSDGFTLNWVRTGSPTGSLRLHFVAFR